MFPWLRLIRVGASLIGKSKVDLLATTHVYLRVWPNDLDFNIHVNNGRYLALADIGRMHWFVRTGILGVARRQKAFPVIGDAIAGNAASAGSAMVSKAPTSLRRATKPRRKYSTCDAQALSCI